MDLFTGLLDLIEIPTSTCSQELIQLYNHCTTNKERCKLECEISAKTKECLSSCLLKHPFETLKLIEKIREKYNKKHDKPFSDLVTSEIIEHLQLLETDSIESQNIYSLLSCLDVPDNIIYKLIFSSIENHKLRKYLIYFTLLPKLELIKKYIEYEKVMFENCCISKPWSLFLYCLYKNEHFMFNILNNGINDNIPKSILEKLLLFKLQFITNISEINYHETELITSRINFDINDRFLRFYLNEIKWNIHFYNFINGLKRENIEFNRVYLGPCLDVLSQFIDLTNINNEYFNVNQLLIKHEMYLSELNKIQNNENTEYIENEVISELDAYNGLCLIITFKEFIINNIKNDELIKNITNQLFQTFNLLFLLELFEDVFALIFLQKKHVGFNDDTFLCGYNEIQYIAKYLKEILIKIKRKYLYKKEKNTYLRYNVLSHYVDTLMKKLQILKAENILQNTNENIINYLVSPPNTLLYYCLENDNIVLAQNVVRVCKIQQTEIANDIEYAEKIQQLINIRDLNYDNLIKFCCENDESYANLMDVILTLNDDYDTSNIFYNELNNYKNNNNNEFYEYNKFCLNIKYISDKLKIKVPDILTNIKYPLDSLKLEEKENHFKQIDYNYNSFKNDIAETTYNELSEICDNYETNYLKKLYKYLKKLSGILQLKTGHENENVLNLIWQKTARIVGDLLLKHNLQPKDFEKIFSKLKLDIVYKISWNFLPEIELNIHETKVQSNLSNDLNLENIIRKLKRVYCYEDNVKNENIPDIFLLGYIQKRNWLLAYLMNKIHFKESNINSDQTKYINNLLNVNSVQQLKQMFDENATITVLYNNEMLFEKLLNYIETSENNDKNIIQLLINGIPESLQLNNKDLIHVKDLIIYNKIARSTNHELIETIENNQLRVKCILENLHKWTGETCIKILKCELSRWEFHQEDVIKQKYLQIQLYENIKTCFNLNSWIEVSEKSQQNPKEIFEMLLTSPQQINLLLNWIEIHKTETMELMQLITIGYFEQLLKNNTSLLEIQTLLDLLQFEQRVAICKNLLKQMKISEHEFLIEYLINLLPELESEYKNVIISLKIFSCFNQNEHEYMMCLMNKPSLIIEQLIMNVRLEKLQLILETIKPILRDANERDIPVDVTIEGVDELLRNYAKKALDFRGIQPSAEMKNMELKLMQSLDTVSVDSKRESFLIPDKVPDKSNWVQNEQALECMCCQEVIFSMFNRRHHCRRCGRVICGNCSLKKMKIPEYGEIPVRVCNDCLKQSQTDETTVNKSEQSSSKSGSLTCWLLTDDEKHNDIAREEFSFEYAPSVSLCLSILKAHSNNILYPRFLLDQCKILLPYLQDGVNEIDFSFMIQMIKSLVTVAKLSALNNSFKTELIECNEILSQIELMSLLVEKDCLQLLRSSMRNSGDKYNHSRVLRRLRDKLIEREQWTLALDISAKVGLDKTGIFAAWGKSYLKAGSLQLAREKFQYCLENKNVFDSELSTSHDLYKSINLSSVSENRPAKTPPLINEIINILENNETITDKSVFRTFKTLSTSTLSLNIAAMGGDDPAVIILNKLNNLKNLTQTKRKPSTISLTSTNINIRKMDAIFYNECLYYLMKYASHYTIVHFYLRHEDYLEVLSYILENRLSNEYFIEIYMKCLEEQKTDKLQETMQQFDCTLDSWQTYLRAICRHLETNRMYNTLYQLQLFTCDYVRAAITCIKFYQENATTFRELLTREDYLHKAQSHLKQELEHEQWVKVTPVRKASTTSSNSSSSTSQHQQSLTMKIDPRNIDRYINTIWRQIEVAKFLAECENESRPTLQILADIFGDDTNKKQIPSLFESTLEKNKLAVMTIVCGKNIEEGFGIAFRIIQDHNLNYLKIYTLAGKYLASILQDTAVVELINCIKSSGLNLETVNTTCDQVLSISVYALCKANATGLQLENIIKLIDDVTYKIDAYIECKQLKRAYLLAIKHNKINDIKKIMREAEKQNQPQIKAICLKRLNQTM